MALAGRSTQPAIEESRRVGKKVDWRSGLVEPVDEIGHVREGVIAHLVEPVVEGRDQGGMSREFGLQPARRLGRVAAMVLHLMPLGRGHRGQETLHLLWIGDQLAVEVAWVPVEQNAAHVENRD